MTLRPSLPSVALVMLTVMTAWTLSAEANEGDDGSDTDRIGVELTGGAFGRYPGGVTDLGGQLMVAKPLWSSPVAARLQADTQVHGLLGVGESLTIYPGLALSSGGYLHLLRWLSLEVRVGLFSSLQVGGGEGLAPIVGLYGGGGYVFRFWDDPRTRLRLSISLNRGGVLRSDTANDDCPLCYGFLGIGLAFETAL
jgi:hypothetical protein